MYLEFVIMKCNNDPTAHELFYQVLPSNRGPEENTRRFHVREIKQDNGFGNNTHVNLTFNRSHGYCHCKALIYHRFSVAF